MWKVFVAKIHYLRMWSSHFWLYHVSLIALHLPQNKLLCDMITFNTVLKCWPTKPCLRFLKYCLVFYQSHHRITGYYFARGNWKNTNILLTNKQTNKHLRHSFGDQSLISNFAKFQNDLMKSKGDRVRKQSGIALFILFWEKRCQSSVQFIFYTVHITWL